MNDQRIPYAQPEGQPPPYQCTVCGTVLMPGQGVCPVCGCRVPLQVPPNIPITDAKKAKRTRIRAIVLGIIANMLVHSFINMWTLTAFRMEMSDMLMEKGDYINAYEIAPDSCKNMVLAENVVAVLTDVSIDLLSDYIESSSVFSDIDLSSVSFVLNEGHYYAYTEKNRITQIAAIKMQIQVDGEGWIFGYQMFLLIDGEWTYYGLVNDVTITDSDNEIEVNLKILLDYILNQGISLSENQIQRIDNHYQTGILSTVKAIPLEKIDTSLLPTVEELRNLQKGDRTMYE